MPQAFSPHSNLPHPKLISDDIDIVPKFDDKEKPDCSMV
jgi:hypothetical protein